jgi:hypothetical protein
MSQNDGFFRRPEVETWVEAGETVSCCYLLGPTQHVGQCWCVRHECPSNSTLFTWLIRLPDLGTPPPTRHFRPCCAMSC